MFATQVADWQTQPRVGSPPIGKGSSFAVSANPIQAQLRTLAALRDAHPELSTGASVVRYAKNGVLVVSRIDLATRREVVVGFNNGPAAARVTVATATPGAAWSVVFGSGTAAGGLTLTIPSVSAVAAAPSASLPATPVTRPTLSGKPDELTALYLLAANVRGGPASVTFAIRARGGAWRRVAIDDSAQYRAFLEPRRFAKGERVEAVAVARGANGSVAVSKGVSVRPRWATTCRRPRRRRAFRPTVTFPASAHRLSPLLPRHARPTALGTPERLDGARRMTPPQATACRGLRASSTTAAISASVSHTSIAVFAP